MTLRELQESPESNSGQNSEFSQQGCSDGSGEALVRGPDDGHSVGQGRPAVEDRLRRRQQEVRGSGQAAADHDAVWREEVPEHAGELSEFFPGLAKDR